MHGYGLAAVWCAACSGPGRGALRVIEADCEVTYTGRTHTELARGYRLIIIKDDDTVLIHRNTGIKPTNYMGSISYFREVVDDDGVRTIFAHSKRNEMLEITIYRALFDVSSDHIPDDAGFEITGSERQLQEWLTRPVNFASFLGAREYVTREFQTGNGACDILGYDPGEGRLALIEVKRTARRHDVYQVVRYKEALAAATERGDEAILAPLDAVTRATPTGPVTGIPRTAGADPELFLIAEAALQGTMEECDEHGITLITVGTEWRSEVLGNTDVSRPKARTGAGAAGKRRRRKTGAGRAAGAAGTRKPSTRTAGAADPASAPTRPGGAAEAGGPAPTPEAAGDTGAGTDAKDPTKLF